MNLPKRLKNKLEEEPLLDGIVKTALSQFGKILTDNKLYFFEEYTEHGTAHIEGVIFSSDNLIKDDTFQNILKQKDIAFYILSVILHDLGMHLRPEGFSALLNGSFDKIRNEKLDHLTWNNLWEEYLNEAKRFNEKQLLAIFGDATYVVTIPPVDRPAELTGHHRQLIGEFIRRNHPRLAHEVALAGFPGETILPFAAGLTEQERNLIGLIARSHGTDLRFCADYLEEVFGKHVRRVPLNVHAIYLMVLLRIADYIQIDRDRTSEILIRLKTFSSPISEMEHNAHLAITVIDNEYQDDPERIYVTTAPKDSRMYFKLRNLFAGIQGELDRSWAVLGELYGDRPNKPEIRFRRIDSNLAEPQLFDSLDFIPEQLSFKANEELIKLLIAPLYGDDPTFGVRELLQNAVDACRERKVLENNFDYQGVIDISIERTDGQIWFTITDNGTGMDTDIIKKYFLTAGASFRKSMNWQKAFVSDSRHTKVNRSGRFGIGVLAAFLLGEEIEVSTRKFDTTAGFRFTTDINTAQIELKKDNSLVAGTQIRVKLNLDTYHKLDPSQKKSGSVSWLSWYTLAEPKIIYNYNNSRYGVEHPNPGLENPLPVDWNAIEAKGYTKLLWTYSNNSNPARFICNGLVIPADPLSAGLKMSAMNNLPKISVFDNDAILPLNLSRNAFTGKLDFKEVLEKDVYCDFLAYVLATPIRSTFSDNEFSLMKQSLRYPGLTQKFTYDSYAFGPIAYTRLGYPAMLKQPLLGKEGFMLDYNYFIKKKRSINGLFIHTKGNNLLNMKLNIKDYFIKFAASKLSVIDDYKTVLQPMKESQDSVGYALMLKKEIYDYLFDPKIKRLNNGVKKRSKIFFEEYGWIGVNLGLGKQSVLNKTFLEENVDSINLIREFEIKSGAVGNKVFNEILERYIGDDVVIPYDVEERKKKYPLAFEELKQHMKKYLHADLPTLH
jgi:molecular chaperone HtpG